MRKYFALLVALLLFLTGCANGEMDLDETSGLSETTPKGYYEAGSQLETQTGGAIRRYSLPDAGYRWIKSMGDRLLLAADTEPVQLRVLSGEDCIPVAQVQVAVDALESSESLFNGFGYYDKASHSVVLLDPQLQQTQNIALPADTTDAVISQGGDQIFYALGNEIRSMDISRKLSRLIKTLSVERFELVASCFGGKILICETENAEGNRDTLYISTKNGQTLQTDNNILALCTYEDYYLVERMDGIVRQRIVGTLDGEANQLNIDDAHMTSALELGGVIGYTQAENGLQINYYDVGTGKKTAAVTLSESVRLSTILADRWSGCVWMLASDSSAGEMTLLRWNVKESTTQEDVSYIGTLHTAQNPDTQALEDLGARVSSLNKKYGVRIRIWQDAVKSPGKHKLVPEHQISAITDTLDKLEAVLAEFPKNFVSKSISSKVRICLVRSVDAEIKGVQYWSGKNAFIALSTGVDVRSEFLKAFAYVIDSHVLGNSPKYDYWNTLNPSGFIYGDASDISLAAGENRAFVNIDSMASGTADRCNVFWHAMLPENSEMFSSEVMQKKLTMLCKAIRDAWGLERKSETYPWEQYLTKSIAYKKK